MQLINSNLFPIPIAPVLDGAGGAPPIQFGLKYCPSMDLIAVYPQHVGPEDAAVDVGARAAAAGTYYPDEDADQLLVDIYRLNGQKVFTISIDSQQKSITIVDAAWAETGVILAIATSDNIIRLANSFSGKVVHTFTPMSLRSAQIMQKSNDTISPASSAVNKRKAAARGTDSRKRQCRPTSICYTSHFTAPEATSARLAAMKEENGRVLDDLLGLNADVDELLKPEADLPRELAIIDIEQCLPKLSTLPANGTGEDDVFSTRTSIDAILHASKQNTRSRSIDITAIAQSDANIHIRIFDAFEVGDVDLNHALKLPSGYVVGRVRKVVSHPFLETLYVVVEEQVNDSLHKHRRQAKPEIKRRGQLHLLSLDLQFLRKSNLALPVLATKATQLHNLIRYLRQVELQLAREVKNAFDLPTRFIGMLEEDLKEQDGDGSTFETSACHTLLTGEVSGKFKEWLVDILGERGVKRWEKAVAECLDTARRLMSEHWNPAVERAGVVISRLAGLSESGVIGVSKSTLDGLRDTIDVMGVVAEDLLREVNIEYAGFTAFMVWLKREVEAAGLEDTSEKLEEMRESSDHLEIPKVLKYISERLQDTSVKKYVRDEPVSDVATTDFEDDSNFYATFREKREQDRVRYSPPSMNSLTARLKIQCEQLFAQLSGQLRDDVLVEHICAFGQSWNANVMDSRIIHEPDRAVLHVCAKDSGSPGTIWRAQKALGKDPDKMAMRNNVLEDNGEILDIKFADDDEIFVLMRTSDTIKVLSIRLEDDAEGEVRTRHVFGGAHDSYTKLGLIPWRLEINGRNTRRTMTVLDVQGRGYGVFDLDSTEPEIRDDGDDDEVMSGF